jgi:hypothetical protein
VDTRARNLLGSALSALPSSSPRLKWVERGGCFQKEKILEVKHLTGFLSPHEIKTMTAK